MCRLAAYVGPPRPLDALWFAPPHSLEVQSYAPREMAGAVLNADGFGMTWYTPADPSPARYRTVLPLWADENIRAMARHLVSGCALANVRSATAGMPVQLSNVSPFVEGRWSFTHNGFVRDLQPGLARRLRDSLDDARYAAIEGNTDSELLSAFVLSRLSAEPDRVESDSGDPTDAVAGALDALAALVGERLALLNVMVTDGRWLVAARHALNGEPPTLYRRAREGAVELVSEPLDDDGWVAVEPGTILTVTPERELRWRSL